jgi:uncharacterized protein YndB with AHSA1/START domain
MLERQVVIPVSPERLWDALTEPDALAGWFGAQVEWELSPGGRARFRQDDGGERTGIVQSVLPGRHLRFRWWPNGIETGASEVTYDLEPDDDGTRLTVTERPAPDAPDTPAVATPPASAQLSSRRRTDLRVVPTAWTDWDTRLLSVWGLAHLRVEVRTRASVTA